jgi:hypothetical protein
LPPEPLSAFEYAAPAVALDKDVVVMLSGVGAAAVTVSEVFADLVGSATLVADTVAVVFVLTAGARYRPEFEIVPAEAHQVTATFEVLLTRAVNCCVPVDATVGAVGVKLTTTAAVLETVT